MRKYLILMGLMSIVCINAQVGINTDIPSEALDVDGKVRVRELPNGNDSNDYKRVVVSKEDGTLGFKHVKELNENLTLDSFEHTATDLILFTKTPPTGNNPHLGEQNNFSNYMIFGSNNDIGAISNPSYTKPTQYFSAKGGEVLSIKGILSFNVLENSNIDTPLSSVSIHGDRQVIIYLYLYKGNDLVRRSKQVINFNGMNGGAYDGNFNQEINLNYAIGQGEDAADYNIGVAVSVRAPRDGNFKVDFSNGVKQYLSVIKG